jgi:hypothetical protein
MYRGHNVTTTRDIITIFQDFSQGTCRTDCSTEQSVCTTAHSSAWHDFGAQSKVRKREDAAADKVCVFIALFMLTVIVQKPTISPYFIKKIGFLQLLSFLKQFLLRDWSLSVSPYILLTIVKRTNFRVITECSRAILLSST